MSALLEKFKTIRAADPSIGVDLALVQLLLESTANGPAVPPHDSAVLAPPDKPTTITCKTGGTSGTTVAVLTLTYTEDDVASYHLQLS